MLVSCGHDENGNYHSGRAGDQTGREYLVCNWYVGHGWDCVLRHPDANLRDAIAAIATTIANGNKCGYDQYERLTLYNQLKAHNWGPSEIELCEADCSSSTAATIIAAGHCKGISAVTKINPALTTHNMKEALVAVGFKCLTDTKYRTSDKYLRRGDIVLSIAHHVVICISDGSGVKDDAATPSVSKTEYDKNIIGAYTVNVSPGSTLSMRTGASINCRMIAALSKGAKVQCHGYHVGEWYLVETNGKTGYVHSGYLNKTTTASTSSKVETAAEFDKNLAGTYTTNADLNLRIGPSQKKTIITTLPKGTKVQCYGYHTGKWYLIAAKGKTGFVSSQYLTKQS